MRHSVVLIVIGIALILTACPSARKMTPPKPPVESEFEDAVRIKPEAVSKYLRLTQHGVNRDGRTLRGVVDFVLIDRNERGEVIDTVWVFHDLNGRYATASRLAIPIRDIEMLPVLYPGMLTDTNRGIDLVEGFHVTKQIPRIRQIPIRRDPCSEPPPLTKDTCDCKPLELGLDLPLSCAEREYSNVALAALIRGSAFTDGNASVIAGTLGIGLDVIAGYRFGPHRQWMAGLSLSTGVATVDAGEITPSMSTIDGLETYVRPLALATGRYYFVGFDKLSPKIEVPQPRSDTTIRYVNNVEVYCGNRKGNADTIAQPHPPDSLRAAMVQQLPSRRSADRPWQPPSTDLYSDDCTEWQWKFDSLQYVYTMQKREDQPAADLFGGCIKPYVYGELGMALDLRTRAAASMAINVDCNDCVAALREANADGSLGVDWTVPLTFGFGVGVDIPIGRSFDFEIDLGYRSIAVGDSYALIGFRDVPDTRRFGQFQLRLGVIF